MAGGSHALGGAGWVTAEGRGRGRRLGRKEQVTHPYKGGMTPPPGSPSVSSVPFVVSSEAPEESRCWVSGAPSDPSCRGPCPWCAPSGLSCPVEPPLLGPVPQLFLSLPCFLLQLALRGPAGPMGLTGRPGPMVSPWWGRVGEPGEGWGVLCQSLLAPSSPGEGTL